MFKYVEGRVLEWMCYVAWEQDGPEDEKGTVALCKRKGSRDDSNRLRGKSLVSVPGKVMNEMMKIYDKSVGGF